MIKWNKENLEIFRKYYSIGDWNFLFSYFETTNKETFYNAAKKFKISANYGWTEEELITLKDVYPYYTNKYIKEKFFPSKEVHSIRTMALKNGCHKIKEKGVKWYDKEKMISDLILVANKIGRTPLGEELCSLGLPSSKTFERYFGGYKSVCIICGLSTNSNMFGRSTHCYSKNNDLCLSKAEKTVTDFFIDNGISYKKECKYSAFMNDKKCKNKSVDWVIKDNVFVEYFGLPEKDNYKKRMEEKKIICKDNGIILICLFRGDLNKLNSIFDKFIKRDS